MAVKKTLRRVQTFVSLGIFVGLLVAVRYPITGSRNVDRPGVNRGHGGGARLPLQGASGGDVGRASGATLAHR